MNTIATLVHNKCYKNLSIHTELHTADLNAYNIYSMLAFNDYTYN